MAAFVFGCAGPTTPLGAVWGVTPAQIRGVDLDAAAASPDLKTAVTRPEILPKPSHQVLHGPASIKLKVKDPAGDFQNYRLVVKYNGFDVSKAFFRRSRLYQLYRERALVVENPAVKLSATEDHRIEFGYKNNHGVWARAKYEPPVCDAFKPLPVMTTGEFNPPRNMVSTIQRLTEENGFSPAFFTALIAQESGFDPGVVSWARALGLTQVTTVAESEVLKQFASWPKYPGLDDMSAAQIKLQILNGTINSKNEWRLDSERSIKGGLYYARILAERWSSEENLGLIRALFKDPAIGYTQLILASYNSGYSRVHDALVVNGKDWLKAPELGEARKYVNKIFSYCSYFSESEDDHATET